MFTGIVEGVGRVGSVRRRGAALRLAIDAGLIAGGTRVGESIALDGVCLTVAARARGLGRASLEFDVVEETLARTTIGRLARGSRVNLERSLRLDDRLGGHLVTGHVDGVGAIVGRRRGRGGEWLSVEVPRDLSSGLLYKGSIAVAGVSLTIAAVEGRRFSVALAPHTLAVTTLGDLRPDDRVNVETDVLGKWVRRLLAEAGTLAPVRKLRRAPR